MIQVGASAPHFEVPGTDGEGVQLYRLSQFLDDGAGLFESHPTPSGE